MPASWNQPQIVEASHLFVFCSMTSLPDEYIESVALQLQKSRSLPDKLKERTIFVSKQVREGKTSEQITAWASEQTHIAVGTALIACAMEDVDTCPIGGFVPSQYDEILGLSEKGLTASLVMAIGYRSEEDWNSKYSKGRKPLDELFIEI